MIVGYFGRAFNVNHKSLSTKTHIVDNGKTLCGYKPHKTLEFQWCKFIGCDTDYDALLYCECGKCKEQYEKILKLKRGDKK